MLAVPEAASAHGLGGIKDLPIPGWLFLFGGSIVLVVSFVALGVLWTRPRLDPESGTRPFPDALQRVLLSPLLRISVQAISLALFLVVWAAAAFGSGRASENISPTFVYVVFWLGMLPLVVVLGNVWTVLNPWRAAADAFAWVAERLGAPEAKFEYPESLGRWPAAAMLFAFTALELAYFDPANPRVLALAILIYSVFTWTGMAVFGRRSWLERGDGFSVYFGLLSRLSALTSEERQGKRSLVVRRPLSGLTIRESMPGTVAFVAVMLGSVAFDGVSRARWWQDRLSSVRSPFVEADPALADLVGMGFSLLGLVAAVVVAASVYLIAVAGAQLVVGRNVSFQGVFVCSLIPIALVYAVAHYLTFFVIQGQFAIPLLSDPFGRGWDLLGTSDFRPKLDVFTPNQTWYIQVGVLVAGHVVALVVAHDRAVALVRSAATAARSQYAMLALMVFYTVGGMWLLSLS
ncbi:MAG: fenitrothion hydrolase [Actinomycetota bacterium]|nr:fenitrothion hydrolase [Actinomycetota bacterium]